MFMISFGRLIRCILCMYVLFLISVISSCSEFVNRVKSGLSQKLNLIEVVDKKYKDSIAAADKDRAVFDIRWRISRDEFKIEQKKFRNKYLYFDSVLCKYKLANIIVDSIPHGLISKTLGLFQIAISSEIIENKNMMDDKSQFRIGSPKLNSFYFNYGVKSDTNIVYFQFKELLYHKYGNYKYDTNNNPIWIVGNKTIVLEWNQSDNREKLYLMRSDYQIGDGFEKPSYNFTYRYRQARIVVMNHEMKMELDSILQEKKIEKEKKINIEKQNIINQF